MKKKDSAMSLIRFVLVGTCASFTRVVSLGDSVSDTGNFYELSKHTNPSSLYYKGRLSNGPVWIEHVANNFSSRLDNYAYAGATSDGDEFQVVPGYHIPGCIQKLEMLQASLKNEVSDIQDESVLLQMGFFGNDFFSPGVTIQKSMANLERCLVGLLNTTKAKHVIIPTSNAPDLIPVLQTVPKLLRIIIQMTTRAVPPQWVKLINRLSKTHPDVSFCNYDYAKFLRSAANGTLSYMNNRKLKTYPGCVNKLANGTETLCSNPHNYLFWDEAHTVKEFHQAMADSVTEFVRTGFSPFGSKVQVRA